MNDQLRKKHAEKLPSDTTREVMKVRHCEYPADDGPLTGEDIKRIRKAAEPMLPKGKLISKQTLL